MNIDNRSNDPLQPNATIMSKTEVADLLERIAQHHDLPPEPREMLEQERGDGYELLESIEAELRQFIWLPNEHDYTTLTLWIVYTHAPELFDNAPRIALHSPVPGCGKSTLLRLLAALVRLGKIWLDPSEASLFRYIDANHPTLLFDEMDKYLYKSSGILAVLNAGHMKGATVPRIVGEGAEMQVQEFDVFGPVAFALKARELPADLADRSFKVTMQRSPIHKARLTDDHLKNLQWLNEQANEWVTRNKDRIAYFARELVLPNAITNRAGDNWLPLFTIAAAVGGVWPQRVTAAASDYEKNNPTLDKGMQLLTHIKGILESKKEDFIASEELRNALIEREDWPWGEYGYGKGLSVHRLAALLKPFGIAPRQRKLHGVSGNLTTKTRGYDTRDFESAWKAYGIDAIKE